MPERRGAADQARSSSRAYGFEHFLALKVEDKLVGCLAMGKKTDATFLSSEDWELLTTISSPVALAVENAYALPAGRAVRAAELRAAQGLQREHHREPDRRRRRPRHAAAGSSAGTGSSRSTFGREEGRGPRRSACSTSSGPDTFAALFPPDTQAGLPAS